MPGLVGLITALPRDEAERQLHRMVASMKHESFYVSGVWIDASLGMYVGWVERHRTYCAEMPLHSQRRDVVLLFSGEEYSDRATVCVRGRAAAGGGEGGARSYLVEHYESERSFPAGLNGRFHGLVIDRTRGTAMLFNDRYGMHRIYWHESDGTFYFAAEAKAILAVQPGLRKVEPRSMGEFVACGCVLENRTLFDGIEILPIASAWIVRRGEVATRNQYFQPREWEEQPLLSWEAFYEELRNFFAESLGRYFKGPEKIGVSLTGGMDSRIIMAWHKAQPASLPCYSFGGAVRDSQDVILARGVALSCGQRHSVIRVGDEFLARFPHYAERSVYLTDGCAGVVHSVDLLLNERAREIAPVRMTGNYGGEVLRRVRAFKPESPMRGLFDGELLSHVRKGGDTYAALLRSHPLSFAVFRQAPWHHYGLLALEQTQIALRSPFLDNDLVRTVFRAPDQACASPDISLRLVADGDPALAKIRTDRGLAGEQGMLGSLLTRWLLTLTLKAEYAYGEGMPQWLACGDNLLAQLRLERLFVGRHKFTQFRVWYRDALSEYVKEILLDPKTLSRPYLDRKVVEEIVSGHIDGGRNYTASIHQLLSLELIHRLFVDSN